MGNDGLRIRQDFILFLVLLFNSILSQTGLIEVFHIR
jgi:hypothetical protein